jgi:dTDP-4-dehydrorhamnose reductase
MRLLVTGAAGMLGRDVAGAAESAGHDVVALARRDLDIADPAAVRAAVRAARPDAVVNCAAWTDVDNAETAEAAATAVNGAGAGHVARAAAEHGARIVQISTDYVFDGHHDVPWVESDPVAPIGAYGRSKLEGEREVAAATAEHAIVRTAWLFGAGGRNFVDTMLALGEDREEVSVVTDQVGSPTWTVHLAEGVVELAERRGDVGVFHVAGAGACTWYELALEVFDRAGVSCRVRPTTSEQFVRPARRPAYSVLASERDETPALPPWQEGVAGYVAETRVGTR